MRWSLVPESKTEILVQGLSADENRGYFDVDKGREAVGTRPGPSREAARGAPRAWHGTHDSLSSASVGVGVRLAGLSEASGIAGQGGTDGAEQREASEMVARYLRWLGQARLGRGFKVY